MGQQAAPARSAPSGVRLAEVVGALSLAADLGLGQPMEHLARSCLLAGALGERMGIGADQRAPLYYVTLLGWVGCIADSHAAAAWFGDDITYRADVYDLDMRPLPFLGYLLRHAGLGGSPARRLQVGTTVVATGARGVQESLRAHCQVTAGIAQRLGLGEDVCGPLRQIFARWDGKGLPRDLRGDDLALVVRLWHVADVADVHHRRGGVPAAVDVVRSRRGTQFDPAVVDCFAACAADLFEEVSAGSCWEDLVAADPTLRPVLTQDGLDAALEVFADYADLKSPYFGGHSTGVADLAAAAGRVAGLSARDVAVLRRAGLVHDLGRTGVSNSVWDKPGPLTASERERVRLSAYYTERMLARPAALAEIGAVAALAHERLDGSGYHRGLPAVAIPLSGRVLAAADAYHAMLEPRPHRAPLSRSAAAREMQGEARRGRLDTAAVDAVLLAAGQRSARPPSGPCGLTPREVEVLVLLARGAANRQIARRLGITAKTAGNHVEHIYAKTGVSTRAAATLVAMRHGLLQTLDPLG